MTDFGTIFQSIHGQIFDLDRLPVAIAALLVVCFGGLVLGPLGGNANPLLWRTISFLFGPLGSRLDKTDRSATDLATRGTFITLIGAGLAFALGAAFAGLSHTYPNFLIVDIAAMSLVMSAGAGWHALLRLYRAIVGRNVKGAFYVLSVTTRSNLSVADEYTITRTGIGMGAKLFDKGVIGPVLWYLIGGLPAAYLYAGLAALAWRFGKEGFTKGFGGAALALEKLMGFVPNAFAGIIISLAGILTPTAGMTRSFIGLLHFTRGRSHYHEGGAPVTAMAWALKVSLGGATQDLDGSAIRRSWTGPDKATAQLDAKHLHRGLYIIVMAHLLFLASLLGLMLMAGYGLLPGFSG